MSGRSRALERRGTRVLRSSCISFFAAASLCNVHAQFAVCELLEMVGNSIERKMRTQRCLLQPGRAAKEHSISYNFSFYFLVSMRAASVCVCV